MSDTPPNPLHSRFDHLGHWLVLGGGMLHGIGARMLKARNDELGAELAKSYELGRAAVRHAYELGRIHQAGGMPGLAPDELVNAIGAMVEQDPGADQPGTSRSVAPVLHDASSPDPHDASCPDPVDASSPARGNASGTAAAAVDVDEHQGDSAPRRDVAAVAAAAITATAAALKSSGKL